VLDQILVMLHPFMPFVTEELWSKLGDRAHYPLITAKWPEPGAAVNAEAKAEVDWLIEFVSKVRAVRTELNVPPGARVPISAFEPDIAATARFERNVDAIRGLARVEPGLVVNGEAQVVVGSETYLLSLADLIDIAVEKARLTKALEASTKEAKSLEGRLSNPAFVERAKPEAVEKARADHALHQAEAGRLAAALARLG
jgi:valyl-tRNA synthetase